MEFWWGREDTIQMPQKYEMRSQTQPQAAYSSKMCGAPKLKEAKVEGDRPCYTTKNSKKFVN
jgi:hypothetical protein